ncbi:MULTISPECIES: UbiA family prenyltransferase [unclassified Streptomyces]|uniref:UbiA family prenyltransferase n=1 Tax=unclassified Streptomyces TaxID=2593676 RepID=UPI00336A613D
MPRASQAPPAAPGSSSPRRLPPHATAAARVVWLCLREARPVVQVVFLARFAVGVLGARPGEHLSVVRVAAGALAWFCAAASAYLFNGVMDLPEDRANGSRRPLASGALPARAAHWAIAVLAVAALLLSVFDLGLFLCVAGLLFLGWAYSAPPLGAKRRSWSTSLTVITMGFAAYGAGAQAAGGDLRPGLWLFAAAMSAWMGLVGAFAKDLGDIPGDREGGRRTLAVVRGEKAARTVTAVCAPGVALAFAVGAVVYDPPLLAAAVVLLCGACWISWLCGHPATGRERAPYRAFMVCQYATHLAFAAVLLLT